MSRDQQIKRVFIANRGEIARRIALTAQRMGIETVAITDRMNPPAFLAEVITSFVRVEDETTALYLDGGRMIEYARESGCDAVHPGFGFLSENAEFAARVAAAGLTWIGPDAKSIDAMASKAAARTLAIQSKVPCIEGLDGIDLESDVEKTKQRIVKFARDTGFPLLIKAAFGGGGKGMRIVHDETSLWEQAQRAASEAKNSFGNGLLVIERYLESPRHVEVQILADKHGQVFAIGDRDCSLQRRHQKIIEEAPAPGINDETRSMMHQAAINLAAHVGYHSAGTVEFLLDGNAPASAPQPFFFLEMNTRLQVEHPVTEEVFGLDLVEWQFRVACHEKLPAMFSDLQPRGHAVEARIYAEDLHQNFFPAPGPVSGFVTPGGPGVRWETGLDTVDEVTSKFDPMVAKLVTTAATREGALRRMSQTLRSMFLANSANNVPLLTWLCSDSAFAAHPVSTHFIADSLPDFLQWESAEHESCLKAATAAMEAVAYTAGTRTAASSANSDLNQNSNVSLAAKLTMAAFGGLANQSRDHYPANSTDPMTAATLMHEKTAATSNITTTRLGMGTVNWQGRHVAFHYAVRQTGADCVIFVNLGGHNFKREITRSALTAGSAGNRTDQANSAFVAAPVPGKVVAIKVQPGTDLDAGAAVLVIESMKMEFEVKSQRQGRIESIEVEIGEQVSAGQTVARWSE